MTPSQDETGRQEADVLSDLERHGTVQTTELEPYNWVCEVFDRTGRRQFAAGGDGEFLTRLSAMKWCLRVIENTFDCGHFDDPMHEDEPSNLPPASCSLK